MEEARSADELLAIINAEVVGEEETCVGTASVCAPREITVVVVVAVGICVELTDTVVSLVDGTGPPFAMLE